MSLKKEKPIEYHIFEQGPTQKPSHWLIIVENFGKIRRSKIGKDRTPPDYTWICPLCQADFYHPDWIKFHYEIAHPNIDPPKTKKPLKTLMKSIKRQFDEFGVELL